VSHLSRKEIIKHAGISWITGLTDNHLFDIVYKVLPFFEYLKTNGEFQEHVEILVLFFGGLMNSGMK